MIKVLNYEIQNYFRNKFKLLNALFSSILKQFRIKIAGFYQCALNMLKRKTSWILIPEPWIRNEYYAKYKIDFQNIQNNIYSSWTPNYPFAT